MTGAPGLSPPSFGPAARTNGGEVSVQASGAEDSRSSMRGRLTERFLAVFDVLGYRQLSRANELETLVLLCHDVVD